MNAKEYKETALSLLMSNSAEREEKFQEKSDESLHLPLPKTSHSS